MISVQFEGKMNLAMFAMLLCNAALGGWYANMIYTRMVNVEISIKEVRQSNLDNNIAINDLRVGLSNLAGKIDALIEQELAKVE